MSGYLRKDVLSLYARILRLHKSRLPAELRGLGDAYVKAEFRAHRDAKEEFVAPFMEQWKDYANELHAQQQDGRIGKDLSEDDAARLNDEQKLQLHRLHIEAIKKED